jgi:hypothetical protein
VVKRRGRYDAMEPLEQTTWLVVADEIGDSLYVRELPPRTDPRMVMIEAMTRSIGLGFEVEELPGVIPLYYARNGSERRSVSIVRLIPKPAKGCS